MNLSENQGGHFVELYCKIKSIKINVFFWILVNTFRQITKMSSDHGKKAQLATILMFCHKTGRLN